MGLLKIVIATILIISSVSGQSSSLSFCQQASQCTGVGSCCQAVSTYTLTTTLIITGYSFSQNAYVFACLPSSLGTCIQNFIPQCQTQQIICTGTNPQNLAACGGNSDLQQFTALIKAEFSNSQFQCVATSNNGSTSSNGTLNTSTGGSQGAQGQQLSSLSNSTTNNTTHSGCNQNIQGSALIIVFIGLTVILGY